MSRRTKKKFGMQPPSILGAYQFSLGGSEMDALGSGFARLQSFEKGYTSAADIANRTIAEVSRSAFIIVDGRPESDGIAKPTSTAELFKKYNAALTRRIPGTNKEKFHHDFARAAGIRRGEPLSSGKPGQYTLELEPGVFLGNTKTLRTMMMSTHPAMRASAIPAAPTVSAAMLEYKQQFDPPTQLTDSEVEQAIGFKLRRSTRDRKKPTPHTPPGGGKKRR